MGLLEDLEKRIKAEYTRATAELKQKSDQYFLEFQDRYNEQYKAYKEGKYTRQEFNQWTLNQIGRGDHWDELKDQMASRMVQSQQIASDYINGQLPAAYTQASNSIATLAQKSAMAQGVTGIRFDLVDEHTVRDLMMGKENHISFKTTSVNPVRQYKWDAKRIQSALTQGILQGDSIADFTDRFLQVMGSDRKSAIRNARTAVTSARSAGKQDRYSDLASQGCEITKIWVATNDDRTREAHMLADGQEVPYDQPFDVDGENLMYPCDPSGSPENVYNCRCTMKTGKIRFHSKLSEEKRQSANIRVY